MSNTTIESIIRSADFDQRVAALRDEAGAAGDDAQYAICIVAEEGAISSWEDRFGGGGLDVTAREQSRIAAMTQEEARVECARVLLGAEAQS